MKRIAVMLKEKDLDNLNRIIEKTGCSQTDAVRAALGMTCGCHKDEEIVTYYLMFKKQDRDRQRDPH